jgi:large-conductance mechanosensitive channel
VSAIFNTLFAIHPIAPLIFLLLLVNAIIAPQAYFLVRKLPVSLSTLFSRAKANDKLALYAVVSWASLVTSVVIFVLVSVVVRYLN